ncbi:MAG: hypothetical protein ACP5NB_13565, partial [Chloroflexia bacterium]
MGIGVGVEVAVGVEVGRAVGPRAATGVGEPPAGPALRPCRGRPAPGAPPPGGPPRPVPRAVGRPLSAAPQVGAAVGGQAGVEVA